MTLTPSAGSELGAPAPDFALPDTSGNQVERNNFSDAAGLLVVFMCNHCPYVIHLREELASFAAEYRGKGLAVVGINANDASTHPADSFEKMIDEVRQIGYSFPYLHDESQEVAKSYGAVCTPDFFLYDRDRKLVYRGQFDDSRPRNDIPVTGKDLRTAADALLGGRPVPEDQKPSVGCNIKWKPGNEPDFSTA